MDFLEKDDIDTSYNLNSSPYLCRIKNQAIECIDYFFCDKEYWAGGKISKSKLYKEEHIKAVMEMNILDALAIAYYCLENNIPDTVDSSVKNWEIELCYDCLKQCANRYIPKCHAGGILLVYLSVCHGVDFIPTLKILGEIKKMIAKREKEAEMAFLAKGKISE